jgi:hypothetical protein
MSVHRYEYTYFLKFAIKEKEESGEKYKSAISQVLTFANDQKTRKIEKVSTRETF